MIWIYTSEGPTSQAVLSFLSDQFPVDSLYCVSETSSAPTEVLSSTQGISWLQSHADEVEFCLFLGHDKSSWHQAKSEITQQAFKQIWRQCVQHDIPFLYLSSYETYSPDRQLWNDNELTLADLTPPTAFGQYCHQLDQWVNQQSKKPYYWASLKLAEVYRIQPKGLSFLSPDQVPTDRYTYIPLVALEDVIQVIWFFMRSRKVSGLFNVSSIEYGVSQHLFSQPEIHRMDHFFAMTCQKLQNISSSIRFQVLGTHGHFSSKRLLSQ